MIFIAIEAVTWIIIFIFVLNIANAALISQIMGGNFCIGKEIQFFVHNWVIQAALFRVSHQGSILEIHPVEYHQHAHAQTLKQADCDEYHFFDPEWQGDSGSSTGDKYIESEPSNVRNSEEEANDRVCAPFFPQGVLDFSKLLHLPVDGSLGFHK